MKLTRLFLGAMFIFSLLHLTPDIQGQDQDETKDMIIRKAWEAMYGNLRPEDLHTIYYESYFHGRETPGKVYIRRPDHFRNESEDLTLIYDGNRAAIIRKSGVVNGEAGEIEMVDPAYLSHFEVDIALAFPAFFEHPSEYRGMVQTGTAACWELYVDLPRGGNVTYFLDTLSHLVIRRLVSWEGDPDQELWENIICGYQDSNGILFENGYSFMGHDGQEEGYYRNAAFNMDFPGGLFRIPEE